jgi:hypothetical protein
VTIPVQQNVLRLNIAIDYVARMQILQRKKQLSRVELSYVFIKSPAASQQIE